MPLHYVTLGYGHEHTVNGHKLDHNTVAVFEAPSPSEGRRMAFEYFDAKFCFEYHDAEWKHEWDWYYPCGLIRIDIPADEQ